MTKKCRCSKTALWKKNWNLVCRVILSIYTFYVIFKQIWAWHRTVADQATLNAMHYTLSLQMRWYKNMMLIIWHPYRKPYVLLIPPPWKVSPNSNPSRWMVSPPRHVLRGWPTCYDGGTDTSAERTPLGWRYTCLLGGRTTTAVLIHTSAGRTPLGWRCTYTCLLVGHTCYDGDTSAGADNTHILRRSRIAYTFYLGEHHLGGATRTLPTWADVSFGNTLLQLLGGDTFHGGPACLDGQLFWSLV